MINFFKKYQSIFLLGLLIHIISAIFSVGHLHPDEHFQILEFLGIKLGITNPKDLPWEYQAKMRPWTQPSFYYLITKIQIFFGIENRFYWVFSFRFFSSLLGWFSGFYFCYSFIDKLQYQWQKYWLIFLTNFIWFFPFMHARISSETVGTSIFLIAFSLYIKSQKNIFNLLAGLLFGLSFGIRYHFGIFLVAILIHQILFHKKNWEKILITALGVISIIIATTIIDYWGYGTFTIAPYEYFAQNILHKKAAGFGVSPWWDYFKSINKKGIFPFGFIIIFSFLYFWLRNPRNIMTWITLPFFIAHSYIGHKEWRFLFPMAPFIPWFFIHFSNSLRNIIKGKFRKRLIQFFIGVNIILLIIASFKPVHPSYGFFKMTKTISASKLKKIYYTAHESPYNLYQLKQSFFDFHNPTLIQLKKLDNIVNDQKENFPFWVFTENARDYLLMKNHCQVKYSNYPHWIIDSFGEKHLKRSKVWSLFYCTAKT